MRRPTPTAPLLATLALLVLVLPTERVAAQPAATDPAELRRDLAGTWRVANVFCRNCGARRPEEIGAIIRIEFPRVSNPLGGNCADAAGLTAFGSQDWREIASRIGMPEAEARTLAPSEQRVLSGSVTCNDLPYMPVVAVAPGRLVYQFEGGILFLLERP
jgi:hypothetical protein